MHDTPQKDFHGVKVALFVGEMLLLHLRDNTPGLFNANMWDFPGGGREGDETPEQCAVREVREELGIMLMPESFVWSREYPSQKDRNKCAYFMVACVPESAAQSVVLTEGQTWGLFDQEAFFTKDDVIPVLKERFQDYLDSKGSADQEDS